MPTPTYTALANITLGSSASSVSFSSIPATYRDLVLVAVTTVTNSSGDLQVRINNDTGSNYSTVQMGGQGSGSGFSATYTFAGILPSNNVGESTTIPTNFQLAFMDYSATNKHKTVLTRTNNAGLGTQAQANRWANTNAITSIQCAVRTAGQFSSGSTFALYGIAS
jgi:hypothetical protein